MPTIVENAHGVQAYEFGDEVSLRRLVLASLLTEDSSDMQKQIADLVPRVSPTAVMNLAITARRDYALRKVPLFLAREMSRYEKHRPYVADTLAQVIERADEMGTFLSMYWAGKNVGEGREPCARQVKIGLGRAFGKFNAFALARYDRDSADFSMQDIIRIAHPRPESPEQEILFRQIAKGEDLPPVKDWEHELSQSKDKKASWISLLENKQLGGLALLKNLRNMLQAAVPQSLIVSTVAQHPFKYVLPFRFISALREIVLANVQVSPELRSALEQAMFRGLADFPRLDGDTVFLVDVSGSMSHPLGMTFSDKRGRVHTSSMTRSDGAASLTMMLNEICDAPHIFKFHTRITPIEGSRGFALGSQVHYERQNTRLGDCLKQAQHEMLVKGITPKRLIVLTDEESQDPVGDGFAQYNYMINVKSASYSIAYKSWVHMTGFSEHIVKLLVEHEKLDKYIKDHAPV